MHQNAPLALAVPHHMFGELWALPPSLLERNRPRGVFWVGVRRMCCSVGGEINLEAVLPFFAGLYYRIQVSVGRGILGRFRITDFIVDHAIVSCHCCQFCFMRLLVMCPHLCMQGRWRGGILH